MKYIISLILIVVFLGIASFGLVVFDYEMNNHSSDCVASTLNNEDCPVNTIGQLMHHISALQEFSVALVGSIVNIPIVTLVLLISFSMFLLYRWLIFEELMLLFQKLKNFFNTSNYIKEKLIYWLSLFTHSPSF